MKATVSNRLLIALLFSFTVTGLWTQTLDTIQSSCHATDSVMKKYKKDVDRMALRRTIKLNSPLKDSISIDQSLSKKYMDALIAVHNATGIPAKDTVTDIYGIHTSPEPELNSLFIDAGGNNPWMQKLFNSVVPTGYAPLDQFITRYNLYPIGYYIAVGYDRAIMTTDSNLNMKNLAAQIAKIQHVINASEVQDFNDTRNIEDSLNPEFVMLSYSYGWGTCYDGCDYRKAWTFRIYDSCMVEYTGTSGDALDVGLSESERKRAVLVFPNPTQGRLNLTSFGADSPLSVKVFDLTGREIAAVSGCMESCEIDLGEFCDGLYFLKIWNGRHENFVRIVKQSR